MSNSVDASKGGGWKSIGTADNAPEVGGEVVVGSQVAHAIKAVVRWWLEAFGTSDNGQGGGGSQLAHLIMHQKAVVEAN